MSRCLRRPETQGSNARIVREEESVARIQDSGRKDPGNAINFLTTGCPNRQRGSAARLCVVIADEDANR